ncbi:hypothetical protein BDV97DRAFT_155176 [Delphinella strobiligena]|nr:hypothetical protein BDV97DRAFT_155176 [Delphinella strobiligena]
MEGAFTHLGNHLISDSASAINAGDDLSTIDADESALDREYGRGNLTGGPRRRRNGDDDETDVYDDDDLESLASAAVNGANGHDDHAKEENVELPDHACAYVCYIQLRCMHIMHYSLFRIDTPRPDTAASTTPAALSSAFPATSGSAAPAVTLLLRTSSTTW